MCPVKNYFHEYDEVCACPIFFNNSGENSCPPLMRKGREAFSSMALFLASAEASISPFSQGGGALSTF